MYKLLLIAGTRPNFIKLAPLYHYLKRHTSYELYICHTGQHFDNNMSDSFWELLQLPEVDFQLNCTGTSSAEVIGKTIIEINKILERIKFDLVIVFGDVNATVAGAIAAAHASIKLMHVEAGLRSFDKTMPEELNRIITDHLSDILIVTEPSGMNHLISEGIAKEKCHLLGNIMIDSLISTRSKWVNIDIGKFAFKTKRPLLVCTFHRPENVDKSKNLKLIVEYLNNLTLDFNIIFPIHPRTRKKLKDFNFLETLEKNNKMICTEPLDYFTFLKLVSISNGVVTDSGGIQEETTFLNKPCVTIRNNTERPVTIEKGTNILCNLSSDLLTQTNSQIKKIETANNVPIDKWDGKVSERITNLLIGIFK